MPTQEIITYIATRISDLADKEIELNEKAECYKNSKMKHKYYTAYDQRKILEEVLDHIMQ